jgi:hypothetical protein
MLDELVVIQFFETEIEAQIAKGYLMNAGIKAFVLDGDTRKFDFIQGYTPPIGVLKVHRLDAHRAKKILHEIMQRSLKSKSGRHSENFGANRSFIAKIFVFVGFVLLIPGAEDKRFLYIGVAFIFAAILIFRWAAPGKKRAPENQADRGT